MSEKTNRKSLRWVVAAALAVVLCVCLCFGVACKKKTNEDAVGDPTYFTKTDPAGAKPEEGYNGNEYVNYVAYVLEQQTEWYAVSDSTAKASVNNQQIWTDKYFKDGYMLTTQKSYSSMSKSDRESFEALFVTGRQGSEGVERGVYLRDGSAPKSSDHDFSNIDWDDGTPTYYLEEDYYFLHGLFSDEMSVFVINDQSIESAGKVTKNSDGTYSQTLKLDTENSVYYYQYSMKNHGNLSTFPAFSKVEVTMTFDENFRLLKLETSEESKIRRGTNWTNKTEAVTTYTYPDMTAENDPNGKGLETIWSENSDTLDEARGYFDKYYGKLEPTTGREIVYTPDATDVLLGALGGALTSEGETFGMYVNYNEEIDASGYIYVAVDLENWDDLTFDFSDYGTMDWVAFALEAYQYSHIIVEVDGADGEQALIVDLLSGSNILEILSGKLVEIYIGESALADGMSEEEIVDDVENELEGILAAIYVAMGQAVGDETDPESASGSEGEEGADDGLDMTLEYSNATGTSLAKVSLIMDGFEMYLECDVTKTVGEEETTYTYALVELTMSIPSIGLDIVLKPVEGDKMSYVTPKESTEKAESTIGSLGLETLVMDLINSVLDLSSSSYINETYTFSGDLSVGFDITILNQTLSANIEIDNMVITMGDVLDDFYISFVGDLQGCTLLGMKVSSASTIGLTWYEDYIVLAKDLETESPTYRVYTTGSFVATMLDSDEDVSPIAWLLGTGSVVWGVLATMFDLTSLSATTLSDVETIDENETSATTQSLFDWLDIGYYVSGMEVKLGGEVGASVGDIDVEEMFGLTDDYWAFVLGNEFISDITSGILDSAAIALTQSMSQIGGIYVTGTIFSFLDLSLNLNYEPNATSAYEDLFGGNLVLAVTEDRTIVGEDGGETTEIVVVGINAQLVPNLYYVFVNGLTEYGLAESDLTFEDKKLNFEITYTTGTIPNRVTHTVNVEDSCTFIYYEYTVGKNTYSAVYSYNVSGSDSSNDNYEYSASGTVAEETVLTDYPTDDPEPEPEPE